MLSALKTKLAVWVISLLLLAAGGAAALAANQVALQQAGAAPKSGGTSSTSSLSLVLLNSTDGLPHWGQNVTFNVSTTATTEPNVSLKCYQNGTLVLGAVAGFYASYPWQGSQIMTLSSPSWTSGAASCTAALSYFSGRKTVTLTSTTFAVYA